MEWLCVQICLFSQWFSVLSTKIHKVAEARVCQASKMGYTAAGYIDDTFLQGDSFDDCYQNVLGTVDILKKIGLAVILPSN
jgi:hypothetical protein